MPVYVAFLRGMNLGRRRVKNTELCECFEQMSMAGVWAFLASGNVVFETDAKSAGALERTLEVGLERRFGYAVKTFVRSAREISAVAEFEPFDEGLLSTTTRNVQVALLAKRPGPAAVRAVLSLQSDDDHLVARDRYLYWLPKGNMSDSSLDFKAVEAALGPWTVRKRQTLRRLSAKLGAP